MANEPVANARCEKCGVRFIPGLIEPRTHAAMCRGEAVQPAPVKAVKKIRAPAALPEGVEAGSTYRYRDPEKRKAYMRDLMRKRRGKAAP